MSKTVKLKRLLAVPVTDGPHETPELVDEGIPFMSAESVKNGYLDFSLRRGNISKELHTLYSLKAKPQRDDIFMVKSGATTGKVAIVETDEEFSIWSPLALIRANRDRLSPRYLYYSLKSDYFQEQVENSWSFGTQQNIGMQVIENLNIFQPSLAKQQELADYLDAKTKTLDKILTAKNHTHTHLSELRQAIISELVYPTGGRTMSASDQLYRHLASQESGTWGEDPNGINEVKCLRVAYFDYERLSHIEPTTVRSITSVHVRNKILQPGDILIEKSGGGEKTPVGRAIIVGELPEPATYANFIDRLRFKDTVLPEYALYLLYAMYTGGVNTKYIKQNTGIQNLDIKHYLMEPVVIPNVGEQQVIIKQIKTRLQKIDKANSKLSDSIKYLEEYRSSLISNVVGGKVEV